MTCGEYECSAIAKAGECVNLMTELGGTIWVSPSHLLYKMNTNKIIYLVEDYFYIS